MANYRRPSRAEVESFFNDFDADSDGADDGGGAVALFFGAVVDGGFAQIVDLPGLDLGFFAVTPGGGDEDILDLFETVVIVVENDHDVGIVAGSGSLLANIG